MKIPQFCLFAINLMYRKALSPESTTTPFQMAFAGS